MENSRSLRQADLVTSVVLTGIGLMVIYKAVQMPWTSQFGVASSWYLSPGLFPLILGVLLILFSLNVLWVAVKAKAHNGIFAAIVKAVAAAPRSRPVLRSLAVLAMVGVYVLVGLGHYNYYVVSTLFCLAMMFSFYRPEGRFPGPKGLFAIVAISVLGPLGVGLVFSNFFQVPLP